MKNTKKMYKLNYNKRRKQLEKDKNPRFAGGVRVLVVLVLFAVSVFVSGRVATAGEEISKLKQRRQRLRREISKLEQEKAALSSLARIESLAKRELGMRKALKNVEYLSGTVPESLASGY